MKFLIRILAVLVPLFTYLPAPAVEPGQAAVKPAADASSTKASDDQQAAVTRVPKGYKAKVIDGETLYCRKSTPLGTRFPTEVCMTVAQYQESVRQGDGLRQELTGRQKSYFNPPEPGRGGG
jgi:hypothetical protein